MSKNLDIVRNLRVCLGRVDCHLISGQQSANVESRYMAIRGELHQPIFQSRKDNLSVGLLLGWRRARSRVDGVRFGFSEGADRGESQVVAVRPRISWVRRGTGQVFAARIEASFGLPIPGTTNEPGRMEDARFTTVLFQVQGARRIASLGGLEVLGRVDLQLANDPLLSLEQFSLGGSSNVRGYRENEIVRDNGVAASVEARWPVLRRPDGRPIFQVGPFVDVGHGWHDDNRLSSAGKTLASVGLRLSPIEWLSAELYWGAPLTARREGPDGAQGAGFHFRLVPSYAW